MGNLAAARPELAPSLGRIRTLMEQALPHALLSGFPPLPPHSGTGVLLTFNLKDFPPAVCQPLGVKRTSS